MLNNITNYLNLIREGKRKTASTLAPTDLIPLGTKDFNFGGGYQPTFVEYSELSAALGGVLSLTDNGTGVVTVDNTNPASPVIDFNGVNVDGVTITGDGTTGSPLTAVIPPLGVQSVTGLNTDNTDPLNPVVELSVDGVTVTGDGTPSNPLAATGQSTSPTVQVVLFADLGTTEPLKPCTYNNGVAGVGATLTGNANGQLSTISFPDKIDNVTTALNQVILVRAQSSAIQNGVYLVTQLGSPTQPFILTRTVDADTQAELYPIQVNVFGGVTFANRAFLQSTIDPVVGTSAIVFTGAQIGIQNTPVLHMDTVTAGPLPSCTYTSSTNPALPGVGATLVATANGVLPTINGVTLTNGRRVLVKDQLNAAHNGAYTVASIGSVSTPWRLVRAEGWGGNFTILDKEWKINNPASTKYGARYSTNLLSLSNTNVGITPISFTEVTTGGLPPWVETDATDLTIWCNGKGDIASNTGFGENSLQANTTGNQSSAFGVDALAANTTGFSNTAIGWKTLEIASTPNWNTAVGAEALRRTTSGQSNTALGEAALPNNNIGSFNVGVGSGALRNNTTGSSNIAIGFETLRTNTTGSELVAIGQDAMRQFAMNNGRSTAIGYYSMRETVTGNGNTAVGHNTLRNNTTGGLNSVVGVDALRDNTTGQQNVVLGYQCLYSNTTGSDNVALGSGALALNQVGGNNIAIGKNALEKTNTSFNIGIGNVALKNATTGGSNIAIGSAALELTTTAQNNIAIGGNALQNNTTGSNNVAIGATALSSNTTGGTNTAVGEATSSGNFNASVILGYGATATGNNQFVVGSAGWNAGAITTETIVPSVTWTVRINGANYKIPLLPV